MGTLVNSTPSYISVLVSGDAPLGRPSAAASCDCVGADWWVVRVVVHPPEARGGGLGSHALGLLLEAFRKQAGDERKLFVSPGGYEGNVDRQRRFYVKNGFVPASETGPTVLVWSGNTAYQGGLSWV